MSATGIHSDPDRSGYQQLSFPEDLPEGVEQDGKHVNTKEGTPTYTLEQARMILEQQENDSQLRLNAARQEIAAVCEKYGVEIAVQSSMIVQLAQ